MRKFYGKTTALRDSDFTNNYLSYWSDNGENFPAQGKLYFSKLSWKFPQQNNLDNEVKQKTLKNSHDSLPQKTTYHIQLPVTTSQLLFTLPLQTVICMIWQLCMCSKTVRSGRKMSVNLYIFFIAHL